MEYAASRMFSLNGRVAIVTGASRGIGMEIARAYAQAGADVAICSRSQSAVEDAAAEIASNGARILPLAVNVASQSDRERLVGETMDWAGRIDILVNNAGANPSFGGLESLNERELDTIINVNLKAALFISQLSLKAWMKEHGGVILNVSSVGGRKCIAGISGYCVVKAALNHMGRCMAAEWGRYGVRVNTLLPGIIKTKFSQALWQNPKFEAMMAANPISRFGEVEDLVGASLMLAADSSAYTTGIEMIVDGGTTGCVM